MPTYRYGEPETTCCDKMQFKIDSLQSQLADEKRRADELAAHAGAIADAIGLTEGSLNRLSTPTICTNIGNLKRFSCHLDAIERAYFMVPGESDEDYPDEDPEDECLLNRWRSTTEEYVKRFGEILEALKLEQQAKGASKAIELLDAAICPCCDKSHRSYHSHGEVCQCQWCYEVNQLRNQKEGE